MLYFSRQRIWFLCALLSGLAVGGNVRAESPVISTTSASGAKAPAVLVSTPTYTIKQSAPVPLDSVPSMGSLPVPAGRVVPMCRPRGRPDLAVALPHDCNVSADVALWMMVVGWAFIGSFAAAMLLTCAYRDRGGAASSASSSAAAAAPLPPNGAPPPPEVGDPGAHRGVGGIHREDSDSLLPVKIGVYLSGPRSGED